MLDDAKVRGLFYSNWLEEEYVFKAYYVDGVITKDGVSTIYFGICVNVSVITNRSYWIEYFKLKNKPFWHWLPEQDWHW